MHTLILLFIVLKYITNIKCIKIRIMLVKIICTNNLTVFKVKKLILVIWYIAVETILPDVELKS